MWNQLKQLFWQNRGVLITTPSITLLVIIIRSLGLLQSWEWSTYDLFMRWRPQPPQDQRIVIVGINETDLHDQNNSIMTDSSVAYLIEKLKTHQPRAIGLDIYRDLPVAPGYETLAKVFETTPNLVGIQKVAGEMGRETVAPPPILKEKGQVGANDLIFDPDNKVRRGLIYLTDNDETVFSFSFHLANLYLEKENDITLEVIQDPNIWQLGKTIFKPLEANDGGYVRTDAGGYQILIDYRGGERHFETVSMTDILEDRVPPDWGRDRIILIGKVGESFKDLFFTPYSSGLFGLPKPVSGVEIHANLTSQIISAALDGRPLIRTWSEPKEWLWILFWSGVGSILSWQLRYTDGIKSFSWQKWGSFLVAGGALFGSTYWFFINHWWIPVIPPFLALSGSIFAITGYIARTAVEIRKTFGRYLTDEVVAMLLEHPEASKLGGERRILTILTSDLRGFTATSERLTPEQVIKVLNFYLGHMADVITKYQGTIDEFMGDGILVLFGAPTKKGDDARRAIACAIEMQLAMKPVNEQMKHWGIPPLEMGIGIHSGEVVVGNIGSEKRTKYGVIGSEVNLTYRIESYTIGGQILISQQALEEAGNELVMISSKKEVHPKGVKTPITIYEVEGISGDYSIALPQEEILYFPLDEKLSIQYQILSGKHVENLFNQGSLVELSANGALIQVKNESNQVPEVFTNIKLNLLLPEDSSDLQEDIYAKVLDKPTNKGSFYVQFTAKPPAVAAKLDSIYQSLSSSLSLSPSHQ
ncbi:adenylate/guanylate cyclase with Chase sensor [Gloeothece citriformis PCC 7424]|uniref:Adenylate/guanylate cyclase with Chase sensor n=1 Tax=Gloeothece citriformis (strain PCC 7424) TaxID=65393 RepID=B7K890_GLOC7|nr:adenylate/guanylate cyclase domain-containing protein [Gloeothece citriformis]ACK69850.1 adenylate/guanylate cyclase with Chase sensor [Gloeothece citriformis PCC 7424]